MKRNILTLIIILSICKLSFGQAGFSKTYNVSSLNGDLGVVRMENAYNGGYIVSCSAYLGFTTAANHDIYVIRIDNQGDTVWTRTVGTNYLDQVTGLCKTIDGNYLLAGITYDPNLSTGADNGVLLIKIDTAGNTIWTSTIDVGWAYGAVADVFAMNDGSFMIFGTTLLSAGAESAFMMKVHNTGSQLWTQYYSNFVSDELLGKAVRDTNDNFYFAGIYSDFNGNSQFKMIKTDVFGNLIWTRNYLLGTQYNYAWNSFIMKSFDGGMYYTGDDYDDSLNTGCKVIFKTNTIGGKVWQKFYTNMGLENIVPSDTTIIGTSGRRIIRLNSIGDTLYSYLVPISFYDADFNSILKTADNGYLFGGRAFIASTSLPPELFLYKSDTLNTPVGNAELESDQYVNELYIFPSLLCQQASVLHLKTTKFTIKTIYIFDMIGETVLSFPNINAMDYSINLSSLPNGIYCVQTNTENRRFVKKILKQ